MTECFLPVVRVLAVVAVAGGLREGGAAGRGRLCGHGIAQHGSLVGRLHRDDQVGAVGHHHVRHLGTRNTTNGSLAMVP